MSSSHAPVDLDAVRARCHAATPEPWSANEVADAPHWPDEAMGLWVFGEDGRLVPGPDAVFIAHARTDIPALLDALAARDAEIARLKGEFR